MTSLRLWIFALLAALCAAGCRTSYNDALAARRSVRYGDSSAAMERAARLAASSKDASLGKLELARLKMFKGDFQGSSDVLGPLMEEFYIEENDGPVLKTGSIAGNIMAATIRDDRAIPYEVPAFELLFALQYQALNSLYLGKHDNARVYLRRATATQEQLKAEADTPANTDSNYAENAEKASSQITARLAPIADSVRASYENAVAWYLMSLLFQNEGDTENARIAMDEAQVISPALRDFAKPKPGSGKDVVVVYEESLVDMKSPVKIPLPFGGTTWSIDFPIYSGTRYTPSRIVAGNETGVPAVNVQALAYRDLKDRIAGIALRNVMRAALKIAAQQVANHINTGSSSGDLTLKLGVLALNATSMVTDEADTRAWQTLPQHVHLARVRIAPDATSIVVRNANTGRAMNVELAAERTRGTTLVWISDYHKNATVGVIPLAAGAATWSEAASLLGP